MWPFCHLVHGRLALVSLELQNASSSTVFDQLLSDLVVGVSGPILINVFQHNMTSGQLVVTTIVMTKFLLPRLIVQPTAPTKLTTLYTFGAIVGVDVQMIGPLAI